jgi:D-mannonate dehydratase
MINYDLSDIKDSDEICWEYLPSDDPEIDSDEGWVEVSDSGIHVRMKPITMALISSADQIKLRGICQGNILEWVYRLNSVFDAGKSVLMVDTEEGSVPIRFRTQDLKDHLGLKVSVKSWSKEKFDAYVRQLRMHRHLSCDDFDI